MRGNSVAFLSGPTWVDDRVVVLERGAEVPFSSFLDRLEVWGGCWVNVRMSFRFGKGGRMVPVADAAGGFGLVKGWFGVVGRTGRTIVGCPSRRYHTLWAVPLCMNGVLNGLTMSQCPGPLSTKITAPVCAVAEESLLQFVVSIAVKLCSLSERLASMQKMVSPRRPLRWAKMTIPPASILVFLVFTSSVKYASLPSSVVRLRFDARYTVARSREFSVFAVSRISWIAACGVSVPWDGVCNATAVIPQDPSPLIISRFIPKCPRSLSAMLSGTAPMEMIDARAAACSRAIRMLSLIASPTVVVPDTVPRGVDVELGCTG